MLWSGGGCKKRQKRQKKTETKRTKLHNYISVRGKSVSCPLTRGYVQFINKEHLRRELGKINILLTTHTPERLTENTNSTAVVAEKSGESWELLITNDYISFYDFNCLEPKYLFGRVLPHYLRLCLSSGFFFLFDIQFSNILIWEFLRPYRWSLDIIPHNITVERDFNMTGDILTKKRMMMTHI